MMRLFLRSSPRRGTAAVCMCLSQWLWAASTPLGAAVEFLRDGGGVVGGDDLGEQGALQGQGFVAAALQDQFVEFVGGSGPAVGFGDAVRAGRDQLGDLLGAVGPARAVG